MTAWLVGIAVVMAGSAASTRKLYPTHAELAALARTIQGTRATLAFYGPALQLDTVGGVVLWKPGGIALVLAGLLGLLTVVRHTRAEEEVGRAELAGAGAVGRLAPLAAALALALAAELALGLLVGLGLAVGGRGRSRGGRRGARVRRGRLLLRGGGRGDQPGLRVGPDGGGSGRRGAGRGVPGPGARGRLHRGRLAGLGLADRLGAAAPALRREPALVGAPAARRGRPSCWS